MTSLDVLDFYRTMSEIGVEVWIDGGWGVDALLGKQTRSHKDLDIAIQERHVAVLREVLVTRGYREVRPEDARPWNFVLGDETGREIDVQFPALSKTAPACRQKVSYMLCRPMAMTRIKSSVEVAAKPC